MIRDKKGRFAKSTFYKNIEGIPNTQSRLYGIWKGMHRRCVDPKYKGYFGKVKVCDEWAEYINFAKWAIANGYSDSLSIDRVDNNGNYEPANCRWVDAVTQNNNTSRNHFITIDGIDYTLAQAEKLTGIKQNTILTRLRRGQSVEKALGRV